MTRYSILDLAPVRAGGTLQDSFTGMVELAQHAERWGYERYWLAEHHNMPGIGSAATSVLIGHVAGHTSKIRVGSGGVMLPNHASIVIAEQFGTLETLYPGRIDLGVGRAPGGDGATMRALRRGLIAIETEFPKQVQELLAFLGPWDREGRVRAIPGEGTRVPVWLLGSSTFSAQLAAQLGLRFAFASHFAPDLLEEAVAIYRRDFVPSDDLSEPYVMIGASVVAADTDERAQWLATTPFQRALSLVRGGSLYTVPPVESMDGLWSEQEKAAVQSRMAAAVIGNPAKVEAKIAALLELTDADEIIFTCDMYESADRLRSYEILAEAMTKVNAVGRSTHA